jgi:hypothetical protein
MLWSQRIGETRAAKAAKNCARCTKLWAVGLACSRVVFWDLMLVQNASMSDMEFIKNPGDPIGPAKKEK